MKKKERAHLKEDPFINFIEKVIDKIKQFKKEIYFALGIILALAIILVVILFFKSRSISSDNQLFSQAQEIKNSSTLNREQKIEELSKLKNRSGISSAIRLYIATLYFEKGDFQSAKKNLDRFRDSHLKVINDQKRLLEAEILAALHQEREAIDILNKLLSDGKSELAKDYILLKLARIQIQTDQAQAALTQLQKLIDEFPQSLYAQEARDLIEKLK
jgi:outer membrane protein assembly factor BamD (BamD/ComL family)